jgi:hypothetical protein
MAVTGWKPMLFVANPMMIFLSDKHGCGLARVASFTTDSGDVFGFYRFSQSRRTMQQLQ